MARFDTLLDWLQWQEGFHPRTIDLGLERAAGVFKALNPDGIKPPTIIVAGTNGKGSCIAFLEAIYRAQGYRVGSYTSPHIVRYNERIKIDGKPVADALICEAFERIDLVRDGISLSYFEFGTLAALDIFSRSELDIQLLEVGLGGRLDAVNIIDADATLITSICIDHVDWLGETREAIGYEKAGVFRPYVAAVIGDIAPPASLLEVANRQQAPLFRLHQEFSFQRHEASWDWLYEGKPYYCGLPTPGLKGEHQYGNAATVLMAITQMQPLLSVNEAAICSGLQQVQLQGRFQLLAGDVPVLLDVAHNPQAVRTLLNYLQQQFSETKIYAVFSMMKDKDIASVIDIMKPAIQYWFVVTLNNPRAASEDFMQSCFSGCGVNNVSLGYNSTMDAYNVALKGTEKGDLIVIFGSFFLVSEYLAIVENID